MLLPNGKLAYFLLEIWSLQQINFIYLFVFQVIRISTFEPSCVGILTREQYRISLLVKRVDYISVIMTFIGLAVFYYAKDLCRNAFFHYTTGVGMGIFLSLVVIIYFIQKRVSSLLIFLLKVQPKFTMSPEFKVLSVKITLALIFQIFHLK